MDPEDVYDAFLRYALFSRIAYFDFDISNEELAVIGTSTSHEHEPLYKKVAFIDRKDTQVWIFKDQDRGGEELVIAFRGSDSLGDLLSNFCIFPSKFLQMNGFVHSGYLASYKAVRNAILYHVMQHVKQGGTRVNVCGHSLGGVCASLCALEMSLLTTLDVRCYTFGAPPGGDPQFCVHMLNHVPHYYRIIHNQDFAPTLPMVFYKHCDETCQPTKTSSCPKCVILPHTDPACIGNHSFKTQSLEYIRHHSIESYIGNLKKIKSRGTISKWSTLFKVKPNVYLKGHKGVRDPKAFLK